MVKVITFSCYFQKSHPKAGEPTYFVERLVESFNDLGYYKNEEDIEIGDFSLYDMILQFPDFEFQKENVWRKHHTIRTGKRFKQGEYFSPRVWLDKPYRSPQITIAPDIKIIKTYDIGLRIRGDFKEFYCNDEDLTSTSLALIAENDGLELNDFLNWFKKPFEGQIICWAECGY